MDESGCAVDRYLLGNIEYPQDLMAQRESHVFKYADKTLVYFQCQITLTFKSEPKCPRPSCGEPNRGKRSSIFDSEKQAGVFDVSKLVNVLDVDSEEDGQKVQRKMDGEETCLSPVTFSLSLVLIVLLCSTGTFIFIHSHWGQRK